ncbi:hypothetical protein MMC30_002149 [Trapelia coarctata]|nr:hypothetical protein [Trapelia coarctata]
MPYEVFARLYIHIDEHFSKAAIQVSLARPETYARFYLLVDSDDGTRQCRMLEFPPSATVHASPEAPSIGFVTEGNLSRIWDVCTDMLRPGEIPKTWLDRVSVQLKIRGIVN